MGWVELDWVKLDWVELNWVSLKFFKPGLNFFYFLGGGPLTHFFCTNLLVRVKLGYTPNFAALGHVEVPWKFLVVGWVCGWGWVGNTNNHYHSSLSWVELSWIESWSISIKIQKYPGSPTFLLIYSFYYWINVGNPHNCILLLSGSIIKTFKISFTLKVKYNA